jgi:hypothetical protein
MAMQIQGKCSLQPLRCTIACLSTSCGHSRTSLLTRQWLLQSPDVGQMLTPAAELRTWMLQIQIHTYFLENNLVARPRGPRTGYTLLSPLRWGRARLCIWQYSAYKHDRSCNVLDRVRSVPSTLLSREDPGTSVSGAAECS